MNYLTKLTKPASFRKGFFRKCLLPLFPLLVLSGCGGGGNSGSSGDGIEALQGLWIQANACGCTVFDLVGNTPTRCFFYFEGSKAVSGYVQQSGSNPAKCNLEDGSYAEQLSEADRNTIIQQARIIPLDRSRIRSHIAAAAGTVFSAGSIIATLGGMNRTTTAINYVYAGDAARQGRARVCSVYLREGETLYLGLGIPGDTRQVANAPACAANRYTTLDPYFNPF